MVGRIEVVLLEVLKDTDGTVKFGGSLKAKGSQIHLPQGKFDREGGAFSSGWGDALKAFEAKMGLIITSADLELFQACKGEARLIGKQMGLQAVEGESEEEVAGPSSKVIRHTRMSRSTTVAVSPLKAGESKAGKLAAAVEKKRKRQVNKVFDTWVFEVNSWRAGVARLNIEAAGTSEGKNPKTTAWTRKNEEVQDLQAQVIKLTSLGGKMNQELKDRDDVSNSASSNGRSFSELEVEIQF